MGLLFDFVEALDEEGGELLKIAVKALLLSEVAKLVGVAFKDEVEKGVVLAVDFQLDLGGICFVALT